MNAISDELRFVEAQAVLAKHFSVDVLEAFDVCFRAIAIEEIEKAGDGRRDGHSKLVYDKATRTIKTVDPHPAPASETEEDQMALRLDLKEKPS